MHKYWFNPLVNSLHFERIVWKLLQIRNDFIYILKIDLFVQKLIVILRIADDKCSIIAPMFLYLIS